MQLVTKLLRQLLWNHRSMESWNHRMVWVARDIKEYLVPAPLPWAGTSSSRPGCSKLRPTWPGTLPERGQPQLLWATCFSISPPSWWRICSTQPQKSNRLWKPGWSHVFVGMQQAYSLTVKTWRSIIRNLLEIRGSSQSVGFLVEKRATSYRAADKGLCVCYVQNCWRSPRCCYPFQWMTGLCRWNFSVTI